MENRDSERGPGRFRPWVSGDRDACLALFDANCPEAFSPNERADYEAFLVDPIDGYEVCEIPVDGMPTVVGAFGLMEDDRGLSLRWILLDPTCQGIGLGSSMMQRISTTAVARGADAVAIAASDRSAPFFSKFGARVLEEITDGWGPGMHRVDMRLIIRTGPEIESGSRGPSAVD